jgi:hypothetical protein
MIAFGTYHDGLNDTLRANRIGQFLQRFLLEHLPWLEFAALNTIDIELDHAAGLILDFYTGDFIEIAD